MVGLAATAQADGKGLGQAGLGDVRLAFFGVGNIPLRARKAETKLTEGNIDDAVQALAADLDPSGDVQATAATKKHLAGVLLRRVAKQLMAEP
jgi:carbon-monoxide dehydrogenase medium subunit